MPHLILDSDLSLGKTRQFTQHTTTIEVNSPQNSHDAVKVEVNKREAYNTVEMNKKRDILDEMQQHLKQMEQELAIVGEESKELQQRLICREKDLEKKV